MDLSVVAIITLQTKGRLIAQRGISIGLQKRAAIFLQHRANCQAVQVKNLELNQKIICKKEKCAGPFRNAESGAL
jgi:hypothetical protein